MVFVLFCFVTLLIFLFGSFVGCLFSFVYLFLCFLLFVCFVVEMEVDEESERSSCRSFL